MQKDIHPDYGPVVFRDRSGGLELMTRSTLAGTVSANADTIEIDGRQVPVIDVDVSSSSHPFWTGRGRVMDTEGRVDRFNRRYGLAGSGGDDA